MAPIKNRQFNRARDDLATGIGRVAIAWSRLHEELGHIFCAVIVGNVDDVPLAAWHAHKSARSQREMLRATSDVALKHRPEDLKVICNLLKNVEEMSNLRNDIMHSSWIYLIEEDQKTIRMIPDGTYGNIRSSSMSTYENDMLHRVCFAFEPKINDMTVACGELYQRILDPDNHSLPRIPSWRAPTQGAFRKTRRS